jgi:hypothetical protein
MTALVGTTVWSRRVAPVTAVVLGVLTIGLALVSVPLGVLAHRAGSGSPTDWLTTVVAVAPGAAVGALVAARRPGNPIGWLVLAFFLLSEPFFGTYAMLDFRVHHGTLPLGSAVVPLLAAWPMWLVIVVILLWVFPDGRLPTRRSVVIVGVVVLLGLAAWAGNAADVAGHAVRIDIDGNLVDPPSGVLTVLPVMLFIAISVSVLGWLAAQVPLYRRSAGERRQQLKWLYSGAVVLVAFLVLAVATPDTSSGFDQASNDLITPLGYAVLPVCVGVAVLKYRLYAIDRVISRVISYAIITAVAAGVFAGLVLLATQVLPVKSPVAVAAATLAVAALFTPLRRRVQRIVDRRFNRARYDADLTVAAFAARLKDAVDLDSVREDLATVVQRALEPAHISVWMNERGETR